MHKLILLLWAIHCGSFAQSSLGHFNDLDLIQNKSVNATEVFEEFKRRYKQETHIDKKYQYAKYATIAAYRAGVTKEIDSWIERADSLAYYLEDNFYDKLYNFTKIAWYHTNKRTAEAIELLDKMEPQMLASNDTIWMIDYHVKRVKNHAKFDDMSVALKHLLEAEKLNIKYKGRLQEALIYTAKADVDFENKNMEASLENELKAIEIYEVLEEDTNLEVAYNNVIALASDMGRKDLIDLYMSKLSKHKLKSGCNRCYLTNELNRIFYLIQSSKYNEALDIANTTIQYADSMNLDKSHAVYLKGVAYRGLDRFDLAEIYIRQAFEMAKKLRHLGKSAFYSHAMYETFYWKDKFEPALEWYTTHIGYRDSVYNENKATEIAVLEAKLETIEQQRKVAKLEAMAKIDNQKKMMLWLSLCLGSLFGIALFYAQRQKSKSKEAIQKALLLEVHAEKEKLKQQLEFREKELASQILNMTQKNNLLQDLMAKIEDLKTDQNKNAISKLMRNIKINIENNDEWDKFLSTFTSIHQSFIVSLQSMCGSLTSSEIRLASLMKMNLSSKEIATMLNITDEGVKKARYRLRKKLGLDSEVNIQDWVMALG